MVVKRAIIGRACVLFRAQMYNAVNRSCIARDGVFNFHITSSDYSRDGRDAAVDGTAMTETFADCNLNVVLPLELARFENENCLFNW